MTREILGEGWILPDLRNPGRDMICVWNESQQRWRVYDNLQLTHYSDAEYRARQALLVRE